MGTVTIPGPALALRIILSNLFKWFFSSLPHKYESISSQLKTRKEALVDFLELSICAAIFSPLLYSALSGLPEVGNGNR